MVCHEDMKEFVSQTFFKFEKKISRSRNVVIIYTNNFILKFSCLYSSIYRQKKWTCVSQRANSKHTHRFAQKICEKKKEK